MWIIVLIILLLLWAINYPISFTICLIILAILIISFIIYAIYDFCKFWKEDKKRDKKRNEGKHLRDEYEKRIEEERIQKEELTRKQDEEARQKEEKERKLEEERKLKELEAKELQERQENEEKAREFVSKIEELGAEYKYIDNKIYIKGEDDTDILELLCYGKQINTLIKGKLPITYEIFDKENSLIANILYDEIYTKTGHSFVCNIWFTEETSSTVVKKEFFSDCCYITKAHTFCYIQNRKIRIEEREWERIIDSGVENINHIRPTATDIEQYILDILNQSNYKSLFAKEIDVVHNNKLLLLR